MCLLQKNCWFEEADRKKHADRVCGNAREPCRMSGSSSGACSSAEGFSKVMHKTQGALTETHF